MQSDDKVILAQILKEAAEPREAASVKRALEKKPLPRGTTASRLLDDESTYHTDGVDPPGGKMHIELAWPARPSDS